MGQVVGACVISQDISSEKKIREALTFAEQRLNVYGEIVEEWIWELDTKLDFVFTNDAVIRILGYAQKDLIGKNILFFLPHEDLEKMQLQFAANINQKKGWVHQLFRFIHKDGSERWVESNAIEILDSHGTLIGFRGACRDKTEFRNLEKTKNEFISIVSHELRTPLTSVLGALSLLSNRELTPENAKELLLTAQRNSERLAHIVNDIIDIEKFQLGKLSLNLKEIPLKEVILESIRSTEPMATKSNMTLKVEGELPDVWVKGDFERLVQLMLNLLSNAVKFSPSGKTVFVSMDATDSNVRISVRDQGPGIPEEFQSKLYEKFAQADSSIQRVYPGTGLGLSIAKGIVDGHGGKISYVTKKGEGTTFFVELPRLAFHQALDKAI